MSEAAGPGGAPRGDYWLSCTTPEGLMVPLLAATRRRRVLVACACVRALWGLLSERGRAAVEVYECFADGGATSREVREADSGLQWKADHSSAAQQDAARAAFHAGLTKSPAEVSDCLRAARLALAGREVNAARAQCDIIRDVIVKPTGAPRRRGAVRLADAVKLAQAAYDERLLPSGHLDNARLAILADALEEGGYPDPEVLAHLRSPGPHVRGCFALDAVLGRS